MFTEVGDSHAGTAAGGSEADDDAAAESRREQRQTSPVYKSALDPDTGKAWRESKAIMGDYIGNMGFLFGNS